MNKPNQLEDFLIAVRSVHNTQGGTKETSYYTALNNLLDAVGAGLKPKVRCVMQLKNLGAGNPDGGLFTPDQFDRKTGEIKNLGAPSRGAIEVKAPAEAIDDTAVSKQIDKYWDRYKLVLVTNLRDWLLIGERNGKRFNLEHFVLATNEKDFWEFAAHPRKAQESHGEAFADFLSRVLTHSAPLADPKDVAALLASYAREARHRIELAGSDGVSPLASVKKSLETALGVKFDEEDGLKFFRSTLVQTLFYGLFAAWVLRHERGDTTAFDWQKAAHDLHVPMVSGLFEQLTMPSKLKGLNIAEVLDWTTDALNRVDQAAFFTKFESGRAVQYFYEPFLDAFDFALRKKLGVWYTPEEIVRYQVATVDLVLRDELGVPDGLADENVVVLDPCCGTGAYLVEVLRVIGDSLNAKHGEALTPTLLKRAATTRLFGFELLPAPYVVAHLQLGLQLRHRGAALQGDERAAVYLTNALTGWEPTQPGSPKEQIEAFPEIAKERDAANAVKQSAPILVILGNPPYDGYAGVTVDEERDLSKAYKVARRGPQPQGQGLNDPYIRFFRMAERQIAERSGRGVISFISNYAWLEGLSHPAMRERFLEAFHSVRIDNLHGDKFATGKTTPSGEPDPSAFSTPWNKEGIQPGTAIATLVRRPAHIGADAVVETRSFWGTDKLARLAACAELPGDPYASVRQWLEFGRPFVPLVVRDDYVSWPSLPDLMPLSVSGVQTKRDGDLIDIERVALVARISKYFDSAASEDEVRGVVPSLMKNSNRFDYRDTRKVLVQRGLLASNFVRYLYRPFDTRWIYWEPATKLLGEKSPSFFPLVGANNCFIEARQRQLQDDFDRGTFTRTLADNLGNGFSQFFPLFYGESVAGSSADFRPNVSKEATAYLECIDGTANHELVFYHALSTVNTPKYRTSNVGGLRLDWPHIPLPSSREALRASAELGREIAALLDTETPVQGVTSSTIRAELQRIGVPSRVGGGALQPDEFKVTAGWGILGKDDATMPGRGKTETRALLEGDADLAFHQTLRQAQGEPHGDEAPKAAWQTVDVYLNDVAYWRNIALPVWEFTMGGYQVVKKWLSYREHRVLGRALKPEELTEVQNMARRIAALVLLQSKLDANYAAVIADVYPFPRATT